jgi:hypothetical protein
MARAAQSLEALWRSQAPAVVVEHFTGNQRLALLSHINQGIAELGLTQAMQAPSSPGLPRQIAIVTHAEHLPASDVQMLQDLTRHLPGLCWRWVLLCLEQPGGQNSAALANMNPPHPHPHWTAQPAPVAPPAPIAPVAPIEPFFAPAEPAAPTEPVVPAAAVEPVVLAKPAETVALAEDPILAAPTAMPQAPTPLPSPTNPSLGQPSKRLAWLGWAAVLVLAAWGTWLHFGAPKSAPSLAAERPAPAAVPATEAASAPDASAAAPQASALEAPPLPSASAPQPTDPTAANTAPSQAAERVASTTAAKPAALPPTSVPADNTAELPDVALRGVRWLAQQSPEYFVLEHGTFQTAAQAQSLIRSRDELTNARVLMRKSTAPGGRFLVITGPFRSQERAQNYKVRENLPPQIKVRSVSEVLQESVRAAPARP